MFIEYRGDVEWGGETSFQIWILVFENNRNGALSYSENWHGAEYAYRTLNYPPSKKKKKKNSRLWGKNKTVTEKYVQKKNTRERSAEKCCVNSFQDCRVSDFCCVEGGPPMRKHCSPAVYQCTAFLWVTFGYLFYSFWEKMIPKIPYSCPQSYWSIWSIKSD